MEKITTFTIDNPDKTTTEHVLINNGNDEFVSMPKAVYDTLPSELSTPTTPQAGA
jgi:hypothetical protein